MLAMMKGEKRQAEAYSFTESGDSEELGNPSMEDSTTPVRGSSFPSILTTISANAEKLGKLLKSSDRSPVDIEDMICQKYEFTIGGRHRKLCLSHAESVWYIMMDSHVIARLAHTNMGLKAFRTSLDFSVPSLDAPIQAAGGLQPLMAKITMEWLPRAMKWQYSLLVQDTAVPSYWSKTSGVVQDNYGLVQAPEIGSCNGV